MVFRYTELDCLLEGHKHLLEDVKKLDRNVILLPKRGHFTGVPDLVISLRNGQSTL